MARMDCPTFTSIFFPVDEAELKECNKINFYTAVGVVSLQSSIFVPSFLFFEDEQRGCTLIFASNLTLILTVSIRVSHFGGVLNYSPPSINVNPREWIKVNT